MLIPSGMTWPIVSTTGAVQVYVKPSRARLLARSKTDRALTAYSKISGSVLLTEGRLNRSEASTVSAAHSSRPCAVRSEMSADELGSLHIAKLLVQLCSIPPCCWGCARVPILEDTEAERRQYSVATCLMCAIANVIDHFLTKSNPLKNSISSRKLQ